MIRLLDCILRLCGECMARRWLRWAVPPLKCAFEAGRWAYRKFLTMGAPPFRCRVTGKLVYEGQVKNYRCPHCRQDLRVSMENHKINLDEGDRVQNIR